MSEKQYFILLPAPHPSRQNATLAVQQAQEGMSVTIQAPTRTLEQNSAQWPILTQIAKDYRWMVNGQMVRMSPEEWKNLLTSAFRKETAQIAQGWDGGICLIGHRTREFGKREFSAWLEFLNAAHEQLKISQTKEEAA